MNDQVAKVEELRFAYPGGNPVLENVSFNVEANDFFAIIGPNGGGKSTLLKIMLGLLKPQQGQVSIFDMPPLAARPHIGYVPQQVNLDRQMPASVLDFVLMGLLQRSRWGIAYRKAEKQLARAALERVGLTDFSKRQVATLSGGQKQRMLIARALVGEAKLLLLDEPTTGIDSTSEQQLMRLLVELNEQMPVVVVTHDLSFISGQIKHVALLNKTISCHHAQGMSSKHIAELYQDNLHAVLSGQGYDMTHEPAKPDEMKAGE